MQCLRAVQVAGRIRGLTSQEANGGAWTFEVPRTMTAEPAEQADKPFTYVASEAQPGFLPSMDPVKTLPPPWDAVISLCSLAVRCYFHGHVLCVNSLDSGIAT